MKHWWKVALAILALVAVWSQYQSCQAADAARAAEAQSALDSVATAQAIAERDRVAADVAAARAGLDTARLEADSANARARRAQLRASEAMTAARERADSLGLLADSLTAGHRREVERRAPMLLTSFDRTAAAWLERDAAQQTQIAAHESNAAALTGQLEATADLLRIERDDHGLTRRELEAERLVTISQGVELLSERAESAAWKEAYEKGRGFNFRLNASTLVGVGVGFLAGMLAP